MASRLLNLVAIPPLAPGASSAPIPHGLVDNAGNGQRPDLAAFIGASGFTLTATATTIIVTNAGPATPACQCFVWRVHSTPRALGGNADLAAQPVIISGGAGAGSGAQNPILWDASGAGDAVTADDVMAFIAASKSPLLVYVRGTVTFPARVPVYSLNGAQFHTDPVIGGAVIDVLDGAVLENPGQIYGQGEFRFHQTGGPPVIFNAATGGSPNLFLTEFNGIMDNRGFGHLIEVPAGQFFIYPFLFNGSYIRSAAQPLCNINVGSVLIIAAFGTCQVPNDFVTGPVGSTLLWQNLAGAPSPLPTNAGFLGTEIQNVISGFSCTGLATRPFNPFGPILVGTMVFDQSLGLTGKPIWWDGTQWVDATGAPA